MSTVELMENEEIELTEIPAENAVAEFDINLVRIAEIKEKSKNLIIVDRKSYEATKALRTEVVTMRTTLDKARKAKVDPLNKEVKRLNDLAKSYEAKIKEVEDPLQKTVKDYEEELAAEKLRKENEEKTRLDAINAKITSIRKFSLPTYKVASEIASIIAELHDLHIDLEIYQELTGEAERAKSETLEALALMYAERQRIEREDAERKEAEEKLAAEQAAFAAKKEAEQKETDRVNSIRQKIQTIQGAPVRAVGKMAEQIAAIIKNLVSFEVVESIFNEFLEEATTAKVIALTQLDEMRAQAIKSEKFEADKEELKKREAKLEADRKADQERKAAEELAAQLEANRIEDERLAAIQAEHDRIAEAARIEALRPDKEKLIEWISKPLNDFPLLATQEGIAARDAIISRLNESLEYCEDL